MAKKYKNDLVKEQEARQENEQEENIPTPKESIQEEKPENNKEEIQQEQQEPKTQRDAFMEYLRQYSTGEKYNIRGVDTPKEKTSEMVKEEEKEQDDELDLS